jgi:AraC family transcriptional regulator
MFATSFPDLNWLKEQAENRFHRPQASNGLPAGRGWPTVILNVNASNIYRDNIPGPLSLFSNWNGRSRVSVEGRSFDIAGDSFFVSNEQQRYTLEVQKGRAETFNIHFGEEWIREAVTSISNRHECLTDDPTLQPASSLQFYNKLFRKTAKIQQTLRSLQSHGNGESLRRDEILLVLLSQLFEEQRGEKLRLDNVAATKLSTRNEILRRLHLATDLMYARADTEISLDELSRASMLSKFHLLRSFREVFNQTPYQFLTGLRIERAKALLCSSNIEVKEIGRQVGFSSSSTFSRRFRNVTGMYPSQYRLEN